MTDLQPSEHDDSARAIVIHHNVRQQPSPNTARPPDVWNLEDGISIEALDAMARELKRWLVIRREAVTEPDDMDYFRAAARSAFIAARNIEQADT